MNNLSSLFIKLKSVSVFSDAVNDENGVISVLAKMTSETDEAKFATLCSALYRELINSDDGAPALLSEKIFEELCRNENPLSRCYLSGTKPSKELLRRAETEYGFICSAAAITLDSFADKFSPEFLSCLPKWKTAKKRPFSALLRSYDHRGCGVFFDSFAFSWNERDKKLVPVKSVDTVRLSDLKEYADEKNAVKNNTLAFLGGLPANNVLLYGDRGTGKSSTVHAILNEYARLGLRLVEMSKSAITDFPLLVSEISVAKNFKFIIFIDDLSFSDGENDYAQLKAALEGSISKTPNILIYATTNRRHLIKETHSDRLGDDVHANDTTQEQLSLSDRFGLVITFINPDKREFAAILKQILADRKITSLDDETISLYAERYAIKKGGRSPRAARQLADIIETSVRTKSEIIF